MQLTPYHQNMMRALRVNMGLPHHAPAHDSVAFTCGKEMDVETGMELARIAALVNKDAIYAGWASTEATQPTSFSLAYREMLTVDVHDRLVAYAANDTAPVILVSTRHDEHFAIDQRGSLVRIAGKPKNIGTGRKLAAKRIKATAATLGHEMLANNQFVPTGATPLPSDLPMEPIVRFG